MVNRRTDKLFSWFGSGPGRPGRTCLLCLMVVAGLLVTACTTTSLPTSSNGNVDSKRRQAAVDNYTELGASYLRKGERESARSSFRQALDIDKRSPGAHSGMALLFELNREYDLAEKSYKKAIKYDRGFTRGRNNYAVFLVKRGRLDDAYEQLTIASQDLDYPLRSQVFLTLGAVASGLGKKDEAVAAWNRAVGIDPRRAGPYLSLAEHYYTEKEYPKAKHYLDQYSDLAKPTARSLWLAVRVEDAFDNVDGVSSKGMALKNLFPYSKEALAYKEWLEQRPKQKVAGQ